MAALCRCEFPEKTPAEPDRWNWVYGQLRLASRRQAVDIIMPDMAGESIVQELDHPNTYPVVRAMLKKMSGILLLIDSVRVEEGGNEQDFFAMKVLSDLAEAMGRSGDPHKKRKKGSLSTPTLALVYTKADECDACFADPELYARKHTPGLSQLCRDSFPSHRFFATGVAGACTSATAWGTSGSGSPCAVEPRGIIEPFQWLIEQTKS